MTTCNQAEYEAILKGLQLLQEVKAESIEIFGDSQLVINQLNVKMTFGRDTMMNVESYLRSVLFSSAYSKSTESRGQLVSSECVRLLSVLRNLK